MLRFRDLLLVAAFLGALGVGVYELGRHVDSTSASLASHDSELTQQVYRPQKSAGVSRKKIELGAFAVGGAVGVMALVSIGGALARPRRRKTTWRASH